MKGVWGFPNKEMSSSDTRLNRSFFRCVRTPDVLAILSNLISADHNVPAFSEVGTLFILRYLKKAEKCPLYSREIFENGENFRTKAKKVSACYMEGKISIAPCFFLPKCPL